MREAGSAGRTCVVHVQCVLCGGGPVESGRRFAELGPLYCTAGGGAKRGGACSSVPSLLSVQPVQTLLEDREGGKRVASTRAKIELIRRLEVGSERREIIREREELRPGGGTPRSERRTGGEPLLEDRTGPFRSCPDIPPRTGARLTVSACLAVLAWVAGAAVTGPPREEGTGPGRAAAADAPPPCLSRPEPRTASALGTAHGPELGVAILQSVHGPVTHARTRTCGVSRSCQLCRRGAAL